VGRRELGPASLTVVQAVEAALVDTDRWLSVACSGGPDSLALAAAAHRVATRRSLPCDAVVVDHRVQTGSAEVAERTAEQLRGLGVAEVSVVAVDVDLSSAAGPEAAARDARYRALDRHAEVYGATVLLGHTLDDQAETVLLGLARGSGPRSLAGMAPRARHMLRPLLRLRRWTTEQSCDELGLTPWSDPQNTDPRYARVRVRSTVLPILEAELGPGVAEALARTATLLRDDADYLDEAAGRAYHGADTLDCAELIAQPAALRRRVIRRWLLIHGIADLTMTHITAVEALVTEWHGQQAINVPDAVVSRSAGRLHVA
jgi:tRNA(Ile)-lysidine synthase